MPEKNIIERSPTLDKYINEKQLSSLTNTRMGIGDKNKAKRFKKYGELVEKKFVQHQNARNRNIELARLNVEQAELAARSENQGIANSSAQAGVAGSLQSSFAEASSQTFLKQEITDQLSFLDYQSSIFEAKANNKKAIFGAVGTIVGTYFGGPIGGSIGGQLGSAAGG